MDDAARRDKSSAFLELFFDLTFVFAFAQLISYLIGHNTYSDWWRTVLLAGLLWWAWSIYAWVGNAIELDRRLVHAVMLFLTGATFFAAQAVPVAFTDQAEWFTVPYFIVRITALGLYWFGLRSRGEEQQALLPFIPLAAIAPAVVLISGFLPVSVIPVLWLIAMVLDIAASANVGISDFRVIPRHFAERHGLFVTIAFGEAIIVIGTATIEVARDASFVIAVVVGLIGVFVLWWSYFDWMNGASEEQLAEASAEELPRVARDMFTWAHFPIILGILFYAVAMEETVRQPYDQMAGHALWALGLSFTLFLAGLAVTHLRGAGVPLVERMVAIAAVVIALVAFDDSWPAVALVGACTVITAIALAVEHLRPNLSGLVLSWWDSDSDDDGGVETPIVDDDDSLEIDARVEDEGHDEDTVVNDKAAVSEPDAVEVFDEAS